MPAAASLRMSQHIQLDMESDSPQQRQYGYCTARTYRESILKLCRITKSAPKFTSFQKLKKPSVSSKEIIKSEEDRIAEAERPRPKNDGFRTKQRKYSKEKIYSSSNRSQQLRYSEGTHKEESSETLEATVSRVEDHSNAFIVDKTGDPKNWEYRSLYPHEVPSYFRFGAGKVIGLSRHITIDRLASNNKILILDNQYDRPRKREKAAFSTLNKAGSKILRVRLEQDEPRGIDVNADFIPVYHSKEPTQQGEPSETTPRSYLNASDERRTKTIDQPIDLDLRYGSETSTSDNDDVGRSHQLDQLVLQRRAELSRVIDADPTNCDAWLDLVDHQDKILGLDLKSTKLGSTQAERHSVSEIKISIYEKAIKSVANTKGKERLLLEMMTEGSKFWNSEKLSSKWQSLLEHNPASPILWTRYLDFKQSESSTFRFDEIRIIYLNCLAILQNARKGNVVDHDAIYKNQIYIILRLTILMRESGFSEYAIALWQSMFEFIFYKPLQFQQKDYLSGGPLESKALSAFEDFWESEVPRVGEDHAEGWAKYSLCGGKSIEPKTATEGLSESSTRGFESWTPLERRASLLSRSPARTTDNIEENDPYRVILFSDVEFVLIEPPNPAGWFLLIEALLVFCHLPPYALGLTDDHLRIWMQDPFLRNEILHHSRQPLSFWQPQTVAVESHSQRQDEFHNKSDSKNPHNSSPFRFSMPAYYLSTHSLFAITGTWFSAFDSWEKEYYGDDGPVEIEWVRQMLKALVQLDFVSCHFIEYFLAFELRQEPSTVEKTAKRLIKNSPFSIQLYNSYALLEYQLGNAKSAESVIVTTINMSMTMSDTTHRESVLLWCTWIWESLSSGQPMLALERLLTFPDQNITGARTQHGSALLHHDAAFEPAIINRAQEVRLLLIPKRPTNTLTRLSNLLATF